MTPSKPPTRRRHAARRLRVVQNPHRHQPEVRHIATRPGRSIGRREKVRPTPPLHRLFREKTRPASAKTLNLGQFERAGRTFSRTRHDTMATLKPTTPLHTHNNTPLKPASLLHPKTAPKTPISHPQRRCRFQPHTATHEQRRHRFQTTGRLVGTA